MTREGEDDEALPEVVELPYDGELDLHPFRPRDIPDVVTEYLAACRERGVLEVRIVHGKGIGTQRRRIADLLGKLPGVERFWTADERDGGWGATWVRLLPPAA